jgi:predicted small lipoprotein YifL
MRTIITLLCASLVLVACGDPEPPTFPPRAKPAAGYIEPTVPAYEDSGVTDPMAELEGRVIAVEEQASMADYRARMAQEEAEVRLSEAKEQASEAERRAEEAEAQAEKALRCADPERRANTMCGGDYP